jgi:hypothetical protein
VVNVAGEIDFARSSRGPKTTGTTLTFVPFARDAVSFAYWDHSTNHLATLTSAQLTSLYSSSTGTITVTGTGFTDTVEACVMQAGSGTRAFWETALGVSDTQVITATTASGCNPTGSAPIEENGADSFYGRISTLPAGTDAVIPFSSGSWISQANGFALDRSSTGRTNGVDLGGIDALGKPYSGTPGTEIPNSTFYASTTYGRNVYVVVPTTKISGFTANQALVSLFTGSTASICAAGAQTTTHNFGFDSLTTAQGPCGSTTTTGAT